MAKAPLFIDTPAARVQSVRLADGPALQNLLPGVPAVDQQLRDLAALQRQRAARRGHGPLPAGSLFDDVTRDQHSLF